MGQFLTLKFQYNAILNHDLIELLGEEVDIVIAIEQQIITKIQTAMQQNIEEDISSNEKVEILINSLSNNDEFEGF